MSPLSIFFLLFQVGITPFANQALAEMAPRFKIEHFKEAELLVDITEHILVPKHEILTSEEKAALLTRYVPPVPNTLK